MSVRALLSLPLLAVAVLAARQDRSQEKQPATPQSRGLLAVSAGRIHLVDDGRTLENGTILIKDGRVLAVGADLDVPADAERVDYGPDAVIVPGLVAAFSPYALGASSARTADPALSALDAFDPYEVYADALAGGVTSAYLTPADNRLIAGTGAMVKLGGQREQGRVLQARAALHCAVDASARNTPGYWQPPVPVAVDVELGYARAQLPNTTLGAVVALDELLGLAQDPENDQLAKDYGPRTGAALADVLRARVPLRVSAVEPAEIRGVLDLARRHELALILDRATNAGPIAEEIAAAGAAVVYRLPWGTNSPAQDRGKAEDARWPTFDVPAALVAAGVRVAITGSSPRDLLFAARLASRGGLDPAAALRAVTLTPAEVLGVATRVGSIGPGKDADLCVLNGEPLDAASSVLATWIDGQVVWEAQRTETATVIEVDELFVGDGEILRPGALLLRDGRIAEVGRRVSRPRGALVVHGRACMPGMIDALGHLGLEGSRKVPATDFALSAIVEPGDEVDRKVARNGITTVVLAPRGASDSGAPLMAYRPAAADMDGQVLADPVGLRLRWEEPNRLRSGENVRQLLAKASDYREKWIAYEKALAGWKPPPPGKEAESEKAESGKEGEKKEEPAGEAKESKEGEEKKDEKATEGEKEKEKKEESKSKKKKKDEPEVLEPDPVTGAWKAEIARGEGVPPVVLKLHLKLAKAGESAAVEGNLRCDVLSSTLVELEGWFDRDKKELTASGVGSKGWVQLSATLDKEKLTGSVACGAEKLEASLERTEREYVVAKRPERAAAKEETAKEPKGKPKAPKTDGKLEPLRRAMDGKATIVVEVNRAADIVACVQAFADAGIRPVLFGAREAHLVLDQIAGRVAGVLLPPTVVEADEKRGTDYRTPYADLQNAGIPVAFASEAEEGAIDLPLRAAFAVSNGMSQEGALRALTVDAARMMSIGDRVGRLATGLGGDVLLLDGPPLDPATSVLRAWVNGDEVEAP